MTQHEIIAALKPLTKLAKLIGATDMDTAPIVKADGGLAITAGEIRRACMAEKALAGGKK